MALNVKLIHEMLEMAFTYCLRCSVMLYIDFIVIYDVDCDKHNGIALNVY